MANSPVVDAVCVVLGCIRAEATIFELFEPLSLPQRSYANASHASIPLLAMTPVGGLLYSVALNGLYIYDMFSPIRRRGARQTSQRATAAETLKADKPQARVAVHHLTLTKATEEDVESTIPFVKADVDVARPRGQALCAIIATESSAMLLAAGVAAHYNSSRSLWWLAPLGIRLVSALFSVHRTYLRPLPPSQEEQICHFQIHCPLDRTFMLLTGPKSVVEQFFGHYRHPVRDQFRETIQLASITLFGYLFPLGLMSVSRMPSAIQKAWLCYQIYSGVCMNIMRDSPCGSAPSTCTETMIAAHFNGAGSGTAILFGLSRGGRETIKASFAPTYHDRFSEGQARMRELLRRRS